ncbi:MAG: L,D-transpeptidase [Neoaquamicrobium sediminum]|uniref:L,D-transpeptidase n=1 Tax=Neoaquamicrobium sediminum TaxID=1849104 RepID=UPI00403661C6
MTDFPPSTLSRRAQLVGGAAFLALAAAGCSTTAPGPSLAVAPPPAPEASFDVDVLSMYRAMPEEKFPVPAADLQSLDPKYVRRVVDYVTVEKPGTVIVDTDARYLYHVLPGGLATRYGVGIGRAGFEWSGRAHIAYKREWPVWTPPSDMIKRQPALERWRHGRPPGIDNPLGARALYIHQGNRDTLYRIHGSAEAWTIGKAKSSGCVRLLHQDVIHLHEHVRPGSAIIVMRSGGAADV